MFGIYDRWKLYDGHTGKYYYCEKCNAPKDSGGTVTNTGEICTDCKPLEDKKEKGNDS